MEIAVLRLGHRLPRDERITTHVALVARAFGANAIVYSGQHDEGLEQSVSNLVKQWGGTFSIQHNSKPISYIKNQKKQGYAIVHLTMYGIPVLEAIANIKLKNSDKLLIVVGGEHVPPEIYQLADYNLSVTNQPHSEVAALAIILDKLQNGKQLEKSFDKMFNGKIRIEPCEKGKKIINKK